VLTTHYMDEAEHLADRVAIIRAGEIVARGRPAEVGREHGAEGSVISFRKPAGGVSSLGAEIGGAPETAGEMVSLRTPDAQRTLGDLLAWAEREAVRLDDLQVHKPSLEDVFLELTGDRNSPASGAGQ
jgi:ABC-2 type transport system ATP-binding protein